MQFVRGEISARLKDLTADVVRTSMAWIIVAAIGFALAEDTERADQSPSVAEFYRHPDVQRALPRELWAEPEPVAPASNGITVLKALAEECARLRKAERGPSQPGGQQSATPDQEQLQRLSTHLNALRMHGWDSVPPEFLADARSQSQRYQHAFELLHQVCDFPKLQSTEELELASLWTTSVTLQDSLRADVVASYATGDPERGLARLRDWCGLTQRALACGESETAGWAIRIASLQARLLSLLPAHFALKEEHTHEIIALMQSIRPQWNTLRVARAAEFRAIAAIHLRHALVVKEPRALIERSRQPIDWDGLNDQRLLRSNPEFGTDTDLIAGHPRPFDLNASLKVVTQLWDEQVRNEQLTFTQGRIDVARRFHRHYSAWPRQFSFASIVWRNESDVKTAVTPAEVAELKTSLKAIPNVLGLALLEDLLEYCGLRVAERSQRQDMAEIDLAILCAGLSAYERREGRSARSLDDLVRVGLLRQLPSDPFGSQYHYTLGRRLVWSNGADGRDDDGAPPLTEIDRSLLGRLIEKWYSAPDAPALPEPRQRGEDIVQKLITLRTMPPVR